MPQSLAHLYVHLIFSTKYRQPLIVPGIEPELHAYLGGICAHFNCQPLRVGGYTDHVHIACALSKKITLIKLLEEVKGRSSHWVKERFAGMQHFYWQDGYAAFTVGPTSIPQLVHYIDDQHQHHRHLSFQDECRQFFKQYGVAYDERYVWS